jgi:hypothetical protein
MPNDGIRTAAAAECISEWGDTIEVSGATTLEVNSSGRQIEG